jgi:gliding motility-associated protein GldM
MSIPKEPRQIMINLMYLVLTALLALNVSNEILNAFKTLSSSISRSNWAIDQSTQEIYNAIKENEQKPGQAEKVRPFRLKADEVVKQSDELVAFFNNWKNRIVMQAGGYSKEDSTIPDKMADIDATTLLLVEMRGGDTVRDKIGQFRQFLLNSVSRFDSGQISPLMPLRIDSCKKDDDNPTGEWKRGNFEHMPAIAALAMFSKFQNDVRSSEAIVVKKLFEEAHLHDIKFDTTGAIAIPKTSYALAGDKIEASILIAAYNKSNKPVVTISQGGGTKKDAVNGIVPWETIASGTGLQTVKGTILLHTENGDISRPWSFDYMVGSTGASLQLDKMNVLYIGVPNPVSISAAGYSVEDVYVEFPPNSGATSEGSNGKFTFKVTKPYNAANPLMVDIYAKSKDPKGSPSKIASMPLRVKFIPDPVPVVNQVAGGNFKASLWRVQIAPQAYLKDFDFEAKFTITSIQFSVLPKGGDYIGPFTINSPSGCRFTDNSDVSKYMSRAKPGDKIFIEAIKAKGPDGQTRTLNSLLFTLTN